LILTFERGPNGYKMRCPNCRSVVRLRIGPNPAVDEPLHQAHAATELLDDVEAALLEVPLSEAEPVTSKVVSAAASALPSRVARVKPSRAERAVPRRCPACGKALPVRAKCCPDCADQPSAPAVPEPPRKERSRSAGQEAPPRPPAARQSRWWLPVAVAVGAAVLTVAVGLGSLILVAWFRWP
jgi:hypothetical protein